MLKDSAVMSVVASPSSTAPAAFKLTLWPVAVKLPTVKEPAPTVTVTAPVAATKVKVVASALVKLKMPVVALVTVKPLASLMCAAPVPMFKLSVSTLVSKASVLAPTLAAVMLKDAAVMSVVSSPSITAPTVLKLTAWLAAARLPTVKLPALKFTVTAPVAVTWLKLVAPAPVKLNKPVLALTTVKALASFT
jgi:hypothetical protein